ncbi:PQQ-dependent sugar dehydrogenase [Thalassobacillus pellis]|uniref:PQQ-dependent sugar dehydrogenase n=1 Tax=Thalassobacillus pellis TaxID=748008 RepID=UPI001961681A|nr:PQQ-dependent sugar dehydrogenase [Thalassobacillus pellis]MBM7551930.1 glucose/arabinose dehydrogenase [Thalassobacillus pellis]
MRILRIFLLFFLLAMVSACSKADEAPSKDKNQNSSSKDAEPATVQQEETLVTNLRVPWDIEVAEGTFFISERNGNIVSWQPGENKERMDVHVRKPVLQRGEGGFLGLKLHPDFEKNGQAFAYHTYEENGVTKNRVILLQKQGNSWQEVKALLEGIPGANFHNGGRLEIGPDGKLYVTTGDALERPLAQDKNSLAGKILRMNLDGSVPDDNPYPGSYIYSYGHRNPQGMAWTEDGVMYASEHGPDAHDEINRIEKGSNYGWPEILGDETQEGMVSPLYQTGEDTWAPSGIAIHEADMYIASLRGTAVRRMNLENNSPEIVTDQYGRIRDVEIVDGTLYFLTNNTDGRGNPTEEDDRLVKLPIES